MQEDISDSRLDDAAALPVRRRRAGCVVGACRLHDRAPRPCPMRPSRRRPQSGRSADYATMYGPMIDDGFELPAIPYQKIDPQFLRQIVADPTGARPAPSSSIRPPITSISCAKAAWRSATASASAAPASNGPATPSSSGSSIGRNGRHRPRWSRATRSWSRTAPPMAACRAASTIRSARGRSICSRTARTRSYRLHGSPEWNSIGKSVSSGCVRLINQDIIDLYDRVPNQTPVIVTARRRRRLFGRAVRTIAPAHRRPVCRAARTITG